MIFIEKGGFLPIVGMCTFLANDTEGYCMRSIVNCKLGVMDEWIAS